MTQVRSALVIGGGIAGPVAALALRKAGIEATIFEAYPSEADGIGGVLMLAPNGLNALEILGAKAGVDAVSEPITRMVMGNGKGKVFGSFAGIEGLPDSRVVWRSDLYRVLHDLAVTEGIPTEYGKRLTGADETRDGITARFADGTTASADIIVGADGIDSTVRRLIDPGAPDVTRLPLLGFGAYSPADCIPGPVNAMHFIFGDKAFLGYWKRSDGTAAWFANLPAEKALTFAESRAVPTSEWLRQIREAFHGDVPGQRLAETATEDAFWAFGAMETLPSVPRWHSDRMVLTGDAAHAPSSSSGQGASIAIESAIELARCLRDLPDAGTAFAAYVRMRRPRVEKIAADAARTNNNKASGPVAKAVMSVVMPIAMKFVKAEKFFGTAHRYAIDWDTKVVA